MAAARKKNRKRPSAPRAPATNENDLEIARIKAGTRERFFGVLTTAIRGGITLGVVGFVWLIFRELAGQDTKLEALFNVAAEFNKWAYLALAGLMGGGWAIDGATKRLTIGRQSEHIRSLEEAIDANRTRSGLRDDQDGKSLR